MRSVFVLDNSFLGNLFDNGSEIAIKILNVIKSKFETIILPDQVHVEVDSASFSQDFIRWANSNVLEVQTPAGIEANGNILPNYGEKAIAQIMNGEASLPDYLNGSDFKIGIDDLKALKNINGVDGELVGWGSHTVQTQDVVNGALRDGALSVKEYLKISDNLDYLNINSDITRWLSPSEAFNATAFSVKTGITADVSGFINLLSEDGSSVTISVSEFANTDWAGLLRSHGNFGNLSASDTARLLKAAPGLVRALQTASIAAATTTGSALLDTIGAFLGGIGVAALGVADLCAAVNLYEAYKLGKAGDSVGAMKKLEDFWGKDLLERGIKLSGDTKDFLDNIIKRLGLGDGLNGLGLGSDGLGLIIDLGGKIGDWIGGIRDRFGRLLTDPIVLDLSGRNGGTATGVQLTALADSNAYFDLTNSGFAVHTGWVGSNTGMLASDNNSNGVVDNITELFGNSSTDGFAALKAFDTNGDDVINSSDANFSTLKVWLDANGNGSTDAGELLSLSDLGIVSINLNAAVSDHVVNGNMIGSIASFVYSDGATGEVAEAFFKNDRVDSVYTGSYTLNPEVLLLPNLRGYGTLPPLFIAMSQDSTLLGMVKSLSLEGVADAAGFASQVEAIVYRWAGVANVDPTSRGAYANAQHLAVLEAFVGQSYVGREANANPSNANQQEILETAWNGLLTAIGERLLAQGPLASLLSGVSYNYSSDTLTGTADFPALITAIGSGTPTASSESARYWATMASFVSRLASDLGVSESAFDTQIRSVFAQANLPFSFDAAYNGGVHYGASGGDKLYGSRGDDYLDGGAGNDYLQGNGGNDTYIFGRGYGQDTINDEYPYGGGTSTLLFNADTAPADVTVSRDNDDNLILSIAGTTDRVTIKNEFFLASTRVEAVRFSDGTVWSYADLLAKVDTGTPGNDTLIGDRGDNVLNGGAGNDTLIGKGGNDTYVFGRGYGQDVIDNTHTLSNGSVINFNADTAPSDVAVSRNSNNDLVFSIVGTTDTVTIQRYFTHADYQIASVHFSNGTVWTQDTIAGMFLVGTPGDDNLTGNNGNNTLDGGAGNDTLTGNGGNDTYIFGRGYGQDTINDYCAYGGYSVVKFNADTAPSDVIVTRDNDDNLFLSIAGTTDKLKITYEFWMNQYRVDAVQFSDGTSWSYADLLTIVDTGTPGNDTLIGDGGDNVLDGGAGNDTLIGRGGDDTYVFGRGYGQDTIDNAHRFSTGAVLSFNADTAPSDVAVSKDADNNLILSIMGTSDKVIVKGYFSYSGNQIAAVRFSDGTTWSQANISAFALGTSGNDTVAGTTADNVFYGSAGTDTLNGNGGHDTYMIGGNIGATTINNAVSGGAAADGEIRFLSGISDQNLWFKQAGSNLEIDLMGTSNKVIVSDWFGNNASARVEDIAVAGGLKIDSQVSQLISAMATYAANNNGFDPALAAAMPSDAALQNVLAAAWHC